MFSTSNVERCLFKNFRKHNQTRPYSIGKRKQLLVSRAECTMHGNGKAWHGMGARTRENWWLGVGAPIQAYAHLVILIDSWINSVAFYVHLEKQKHKFSRGVLVGDGGSCSLQIEMRYGGGHGGAGAASRIRSARLAHQCPPSVAFSCFFDYK